MRWDGKKFCSIAKRRKVLSFVFLIFLLFSPPRKWDRLRPWSVWFMWRSIKTPLPCRPNWEKKRKRECGKGKLPLVYVEFFSIFHAISGFSSSFLVSFHILNSFQLSPNTFHAPSFAQCHPSKQCFLYPCSSLSTRENSFHSITGAHTSTKVRARTKRKLSGEEGWKMQTIYENEILKIDLSSTQFCKFSKKLSFLSHLKDWSMENVNNISY